MASQRASPQRAYRKAVGNARFEDRHQRLTTYVENELFREVQSLRERGSVLNLTHLVNEALDEYLSCHYRLRIAAKTANP